MFTEAQEIRIARAVASATRGIDPGDETAIRKATAKAIAATLDAFDQEDKPATKRGDVLPFSTMRTDLQGRKGQVGEA